MRGVNADGEVLRSARLRRVLTQEQLAGLAAVDTKTVRKAERGGPLDVATLARLSTALGISIDRVVSDRSRDTPMQADLRAIARRWVTAWDAQDIEALIALFHQDAVLHLPGAPLIPFGGTHCGKEAIRQANETAWATCRTLPEPVENYSVIVSNDFMIIQGLKGILLPDSRVVRLWGVHLFTLEAGLIVDLRVEYDTLQFAEIVGLPLAGLPSR